MKLAVAYEHAGLGNSMTDQTRYALMGVIDFLSAPAGAYCVRHYEPCKYHDEPGAADRPRIVLEHFFGGTTHVLDLPDAEHIHLTRNGDGTWTAVPMRPAPVFWTGSDGEVLALDPFYVLEHEGELGEWAWVDEVPS